MGDHQGPASHLAGRYLEALNSPNNVRIGHISTLPRDQTVTSGARANLAFTDLYI